MYTEQKFNLSKMEGISEKQIDIHLGLYAGYVKNVNALKINIEELKKDPEANVIAIAELSRRLSFEWNGMRMHEYYFETLGGDGKPEGVLKEKIENAFGNYETWEKEFKRIGKLRGIGWAVLALDKKTNTLENIWVNDHELGHLAGASILIAMDVWEHAFLIDYLPSERGNYIDAFFNNLDWTKLSNRL